MREIEGGGKQGKWWRAREGQGGSMQTKMSEERRAAGKEWQGRSRYGGSKWRGR